MRNDTLNDVSKSVLHSRDWLRVELRLQVVDIFGADITTISHPGPALNVSLNSQSSSVEDSSGATSMPFVQVCIFCYLFQEFSFQVVMVQLCHKNSILCPVSCVKFFIA
jgi:hypothetical protein